MLSHPLGSQGVVTLTHFPPVPKSSNHESTTTFNSPWFTLWAPAQPSLSESLAATRVLTDLTSIPISLWNSRLLGRQAATTLRRFPHLWTGSHEGTTDTASTPNTPHPVAHSCNHTVYVQVSEVCSSKHPSTSFKWASQKDTLHRFWRLCWNNTASVSSTFWYFFKETDCNRQTIELGVEPGDLPKGQMFAVLLEMNTDSRPHSLKHLQQPTCTCKHCSHRPQAVAVKDWGVSGGVALHDPPCQWHMEWF